MLDEAQLATTLALKPVDEVAAAGAGATSAADPVRAAQEKLNAVGYDAGPMDGILGPRTKRALIRFQAVEGLELTGELDAATRARLLSATAVSAASR
jgi:peptidoglycan hydrolase-like protein with peptidoglycan-binding domain